MSDQSRRECAHCGGTYDQAMGATVHATNCAAAFPASTAGKAALDVIEERKRQVQVEGWAHSHDDKHHSGELGLAAALYAIPYECDLIQQDDFIGLHMLLEMSFDWNLKPEPDRRRRLVKAGALILAEIERLDRATVHPAQRQGGE
jgi:hypothetical protein